MSMKAFVCSPVILSLSVSNAFAGGNDGGNPIGLFPGLSTCYSHSLSDRLKAGVGIYDNFGLALDYEDGWVGRYHFQEGTLIGFSIAPTLAYKVTEVCRWTGR